MYTNKQYVIILSLPLKKIKTMAPTYIIEFIIFTNILRKYTT